jgi:hypothetical protein
VKHPKSTKHILFLVTATLALLLLLPVQTAWSQGTNTKVQVDPKDSVAIIGENFTVNVTVSNVQNLFGLNLTVNWNASLLQIVAANTQLGVETYPGGVLYGNRLNFDYDALVEGDIYIGENLTLQSEGEYHLVAACVGDGPSFSGTGTIVILTFKVLDLGDSAITVQSDLADKPIDEETDSNYIDHIDVGGAVAAVIPEFPAIAIVALLIGLVTVSLMLSKKNSKKLQ